MSTNKLKLSPSPFLPRSKPPSLPDFPKMIQAEEYNLGTILHPLLMLFYSRNNLSDPLPLRVSLPVQHFPSRLYNLFSSIIGPPKSLGTPLLLNETSSKTLIPLVFCRTLIPGKPDILTDPHTLFHRGYAPLHKVNFFRIDRKSPPLGKHETNIYTLCGITCQATR